MSDHPIIFSAPMVRALLDGRKTMTRRLAWMPPRKSRYEIDALDILGWRPGDDGVHHYPPSPWQRVKPGERLWVREAWGYHGGDEMLYQREPGAVGFRADIDTDPRLRDGRIPGGYWRPSIHMPRWASRLTLVVTAARVEQLQAITEADARAEGVLYVPGHGDIEPGDLHEGFSNYLCCRQGFEILWNTLHGPDAWDANPEVVALTFTVHRANIDDPPQS